METTVPNSRPCLSSDSVTCAIKKGIAPSQMLQEAIIFIIDEVTLLHRKVAAAIGNTLRDIRSSNDIMDGLLTLLCGDFRQILPVVPHGTQSNIVDACLKSSYLWPSVTSFQLTTNIRVLLNADEGVQIEVAPDYISIHHFGKKSVLT